MSELIGTPNICCGYVGYTVSGGKTHFQIDYNTLEIRFLTSMVMQCPGCGTIVELKSLARGLVGVDDLEANQAFSVWDAEQVLRCA